MYRLVITLCLISGVYSGVTMRRHGYSHQIARLARTDAPTELNGRTYNNIGDISGKLYFDEPHAKQNDYDNKDSITFKTAEKLRNESPRDYHTTFPRILTESSMAHTFTPLPRYDYNYKRPRNIDSSIKYASPDVISGVTIDRLKSPKSKPVNDVFYGYDGDFHNDDEDVRTSGRNTYENYASFFYHNPYEYDHKIIDLDKAKDKRYVDVSERIIPVHESTDNVTLATPTYEASTIPNDNPIGGNGPFFSFVLNDYFDRNHEEDTLSFKGLGVDWGKDFDHESYRPVDDSRRDRRLENLFTPVVRWLTTPRPYRLQKPGSSDRYIKSEDRTNEKTKSGHFGYDNHGVGDNKHSTYRQSDGTEERQYEGFKDFLDSFANKFGMAENKGDANYIHQMIKDQGEKKKGFHRVYHKDEFLEDKEFFDNSNSSNKAADKGSSNYKFGGSEAILRSQALGAERHATDANSKLMSGNDEKYEHFHKGDSNALENKFDKYINVAKQAAKSNNADYMDHEKV